MKKRWIATLLCLSMVLSAAGCAGKEPEVNTKPEPKYVTEEKKYEPTEEEPEVIEKNILKKGINQFGFALYDRLDRGENSFYSPYSLVSALSLLDIGAGGVTKEELEEMLGIDDLDAWKWAMRDYLQKEWGEETYLLTANAIWMDENKEWAKGIEEDFIAPAQVYFNGAIKRRDFKKPEDIIKEVNNWASENTKGMIQKVLEQLDPYAKMVLANAVYFDGKWQNPFMEDNTRDRTFYGLKEEKKVPMMAQYGSRYGYYEDGKIKGVMLPYKDSSVVMKIFIPVDKEDYIGDLMADLSVKERQELLEKLDNKRREELSVLEIPKFEFDYEIAKLDEILQDMGMVSAYLENADFDKVANDLCVDTVIHKAKIVVDEQGTKAAAVTVIVDKEASAAFDEVYYDFIADVPFFFVIEDTETGVVLFMGEINDL